MSVTGPPAGDRSIGNGRYVLLQEIGWGGAGVVWRGEDRVIQRPVAVKEAIMSRNLPVQQREVAMQRMLREVRATGQLNHPAALTIYDVLWDEESGAIYIVMELVDGSSLSEALKRTGPMHPRWAARIALNVLDVLEAAHEAGIIHRDIKPNNVMLPSTDDAPAKLADFGLAWVSGDVSLTQSDMIVGSPAYLSPEQINGGQVTRATDLWQLGVTFYEMMCGFSPFSRDDQQATLFAIIGSDPPPLDCGEPLASTITGLLNKQPEKRPTAAELRAVLEQYASRDRTSGHGTTTSRPSLGGAQHTSRWRRPAAVAGTVLLVVCAATGGALLGRRTGTFPGPAQSLGTGASSAEPARPEDAIEQSWDSDTSGLNQDRNSVDMSKLYFANTACLNRSPDINRDFWKTACEQPHALEVFDSYELPALPGAEYPPALLTAAAADFCQTSYASYGKSSWLRGQDIRLTSMFPSESRWNLGQQFSNVVYCAASPVDESQMMPASGLIAE